MSNSLEATLLSIMQNIRALDSNNPYYGPNASALALVEGVKSDGKLDQKDINELVYNTALDQGLNNNPEQIFQKIIYKLQEDSNAAESIEKYAIENNIDLDTIFSPETLPQFGEFIQSMLDRT